MAKAAQEPVPGIPLTEPAEGVPEPLTTVAEFAECAAALRRGTGPIALDTERASGFTYSSRAYLIQIKRTGSGLFLLDPIHEPEGLAPVIEALRGVEWVLHAADQDLPCLRDDGFVCDALFDTELAGRLLGEPRVNLAAMTSEFTGYALAKGHGAADWSTRPLPHDWLNYAALDVELLVDLRDEAYERLDAAGKLPWALEEFEYARTRPDPAPKPDPWRRLSGLSTLRTRRQLGRARELWLARDEMAEQRNVAPGRTLPDAAIVNAAAKNPTTEAELTALPVFGGPRMRRSATRWMGAINRANALPDSALPPLHGPRNGVPANNRWSKSNPEAAERLARVRAALSEISEEVQVPVENLLPPDAVRQLCWDDTAHGRDQVDAALAASGARSWQRDLTARAVADALG
ncbi:3'-5' exonuclease OS=Tsukamurella paurometabola (strain ATCC 8368 / DSM / CCUG 35730 / CIP 100753/ JCM 10117 / KCTC 9821 / NBRC 16120 / NCIMB 702349 /NCTC 13040) OX=521096 GN=Tpau_1890 PE=4 SV=1 [Tsukamurella paurometabola]|uniref:3'-5' exonuclease n=1 Tax=Tsukamurella paurometabola (strain ATCC 8368 / DSM 20162 / CCUG 35730 / CIP 100753 / JCM 10117 / KCTC 9821 / NBRC 16120 / NCIMB 702349 / NCTC 13040) TaxID=521096 RepID=D5UN06_TSUPD|nr:ribonuclease D [Tsukamurella paurometabola]ADG78503.1 3'-5' exonuclease [Tsukamurella paurometabola DSM 20162]SUP31947.1 Ribonuclease D [Tsukamurella paurometabola]